MKIYTGKDLPSLDRLRAILDYNPDTGKLTSKIKRGSRTMPGREVGSVKAEGRVIIQIDGVEYKAHRVAWFMHYGTQPPMELDHKDKDGTNNRIANLRCVTRRENVMNRGIAKNNTSGTTGVMWVKRAKQWLAVINFDSQPRSLGYFKEKTDAIAVRRLAELMYHSPYRAD